MIGFDIKATGSGDFHWHRGTWTEGSLWLAKAAFTVMPKCPECKGSKAAVTAIEKGFKRIKNNMFKNVAGLGMDLHLTVTGDFNFMYQFLSSKSEYQTAEELLELIAGQKEDLGDQVMIYFCKCILDFQLHTITEGIYNDDKLWLNVEIDL